MDFLYIRHKVTILQKRRIMHWSKKIRKFKMAAIFKWEKLLVFTSDNSLLNKNERIITKNRVLVTHNGNIINNRSSSYFNILF